MSIGGIMSKLKNTLKGILIALNGLFGSVYFIEVTLGSKKTKNFIPNLSASPSHICFRNYEEGNVYKETIQIFNRDLKCYHLALKFNNPEEIKLTIVGSVSKTRIDSGEDILLEIEFRPVLSFRKESVDRRYEICLNVVNANAKFFIPILVLSPNPVINFPKEILLPDTAVNTPAYSNIFVLNYSNQNQKFSFESRDDIKIIPDCKSIGMKASDSSTYLIELIPKAVGVFREKIQVCLSNGKKLSIILKCNVIPINIFLNEENVEFAPTFIGMTDSKEIHIVNNSDEATYFEWIPHDQILDISSNYLQILPMNGELQPNTITTISLVFNPTDTSDEYEILREVFLTFTLKLSVEPDYHPHINMRGKIIGPSFQIDLKRVDIGFVFLGESRFIDINILNTGVIDGKIIFQKSPSSFDGIVKVSSKFEIISPGTSKYFKIKYLARKVGKFIEQAFFKVKNGERLPFVIQGVIKPLEIKMVPNVLDFGGSSICIPQMLLMLLRNDQPFDINVQVEIENAGADDALEFVEFFQSRSEVKDETLCNSENPLEIYNLPSLMSGENSVSSESCSSLLTRSVIKCFMERSGNLQHLSDSIISVRDGIKNIQNQVDEYLERNGIVQSIIRFVFEGQVKEEQEKFHIAGTVVDLLLENITGTQLADFTRFDFKKWIFSENPREVNANKSIIKLPSNSKTSIELKVFLTPNFIGKFTKNLKLKLMISNLSLCPKQSVEETTINVPIMYNCLPAELLIHNQINNITGFAESEILLEILLENTEIVDGFFMFNRFEDSELDVKCEEEKFHIAGRLKKTVNLIVTPLKSGLIVKNVNFVVLGSNRKFPISIECKSLPPDIIVKPNKIIESDLEVLVKHDSNIFIENRNSTKARFFVKLDHDNQALELNPRGGILSCKQSVMVTLQKLFCDPGEYRNNLLIEIVNSKTVKIPIRCTIRKLPILIEPAFSDVINFGTLFVSKTPYFLEYTLTNGGKKAYMIFIILKNWKNKIVTRFLIVPNRFELMPNTSKSVKFYINAENPMNEDEEFTIEGCSTNFPVREVIWDSRLKASLIEPSLCFSISEVVFNYFYGGTDQGRKYLTEVIQIMNKSNLSLTVCLKIDGEFHFLNDENRKFDQKIKFDMKKMESCDIAIGFNSCLVGESNTAVSFKGKLNAYSLGKLQLSINLQANIIFPTVQISDSELNVVSNCLPFAFTFKITNNGEMDLTFDLKFNETSTKITKIRERHQDNLMNISQCLMKQNCNLRETFFKNDSNEQKIEAILNETAEDRVDDLMNVNALPKLNESGLEGEAEKKRKEKKNKASANAHMKAATKDFINLDINEFLESTFDCEVEISDIQKYLKNLTRAQSEVLCNKDYRSLTPVLKAQKSAKAFEESANKYLKLSQLKGSLKPLESRMISIYFVGSSEAFHLSTLLQLQVTGGLLHDITINLTNCNPNLLVTKTYFEIPEHPWDEILLKNFCISNISPSSNKIKLIADKSTDQDHYLVDGYIKLSAKNAMNFVLDEQRNFCSNIQLSIFTGCSGMFKNEIGVQVNDKPPIPISFFGRNQFQTATLLNVNQQLKEIDKEFEYDCLRKMFKYVSQIRVPDEIVKVDAVLRVKNQLMVESMMTESNDAKSRKKSVKKNKNKNSEPEAASIKVDSQEKAAGDCEMVLRDCKLFYDDNGKVLWRERAANLYSAKLLHLIDESLDKEDFLVLDYPQEYPEAVEITNFIAQQGWKASLKSDIILKEYKEIYKRHVYEKFRQVKSIRTGRVSGQPEIIQEKCVVPLPLTLQQYEINLGTVQLNGSVEKIVQFYYHGSQLSAALRTESIVPGFIIKFLQRSETERHFQIFDIESISINQEKKYQNRLEREKCVTDATLPVLKRYHSFDFTNGRVHSRKVPVCAEKRNNINQSYNELMCPKFKEKKSHLVQSEFYQNFLATNDSRIFEFKIMLAPSSDFFSNDSDFDEIIYLNIHLGPQIPIVVKAKIVEKLGGLN